MKPIKFKEQNVVFGEGQEEYLPLPAHLDKGVRGYVVSCWRLSVCERIRLLFTGRLWLSQMSFHNPLQPQFPTTRKRDIFNKPRRRIFGRLVEAFKKTKTKTSIGILFLLLTFSACTPRTDVSGYVVDMEFVPKHSETSYNIVLKMPQSKTVPDRWVVWIADRNRVVRVDVREETYKKIIKGNFVELKTEQ